MNYGIKLMPTYWACVSGGKDSLFMLKLILSNPKKYPLNGVVHYELEIDYPFIKNVIDYMQSECEKFGIPFLRIKPRESWENLYNRYGFPTRIARWCNSEYKLDAAKQLDYFMKKNGKYVINYIGFCVDEEIRHKKRNNEFEKFPLVENNIKESTILKWAREQDIFNNFYLTNNRCGCMYCPISSMLNYAYLYKYYPENFTYMIKKMRETEIKRSKELNRSFSVISSDFRYDSRYLEKIIKTKWIHKLNDLEVERMCES